MDDQEKGLELVADLKTKLSDVITHVQQQAQKVAQGDWNTAKGVSFLEVKYQMLLSYLINLTQLLCNKVKGQSIQGDPTIERLVEIRTVLEKMRPIDQKLRYQIDKLLKTATTGTLGQNDPLRLKPNPDNLQSKFEEEGDEDSEEEEDTSEKPSSSNIYRPPKLSAMYYDGDDTVQDREVKRLARAKKKALSSSIMRDLHDEYYDGPEEIMETADLHRMKEDKAGKERTEYEEKYLLRTSVSRKEKFAALKLRSGVDDLTRFSDISALTEDGPLEEATQSRKRKKISGKKKGKVSKMFKRRK